VGLADWDDHLTRWLAEPPFRDEAGRKGWLERFSRAQPHQVRRFSLSIAGWPRWPRPLRIAFLSDFHVGSHAGDVARLTAIVDEAASLAPDIALLGGDFVNMMPFGGGRVPPFVIARALARLAPPLGRAAVLGNHDRNYDPEEVTAALQHEGIAVLGDRPHHFAFGGAEIDVIGIHDARCDQPQGRALLAALRPDRPTIVLAHDPVWFAQVPAGPHLVLAGHTHGGQIRLPWIGPLRNASHAPMRWTLGLIEEDGKRMIVTGGLGCSGIPLRVGVLPEYALIEVNGA
jgi:predicted MPP superfamily phosphohydrolase